ncbi:Low molecular weight protein-tyrosine-phosphatase Etp [invertebrate metagenome]|uniref:Low molecular weight protein-tyrosine-phosphatase Etp n=1 Tax=invertebrate metagenome TaxID=1711999 RepID=A0A2H9T6C6_9ZZZZ
MALFSSVLMVCIGNICRSPTAEYALRQKLSEKNSDIIVASAGLHGLTGHTADESASRFAKTVGVDLSQHSARKLTREMVHQYDLVLVMEISHVKAVEQLAPESRGKVHLLGCWNNNIEIPDPYRRGDAAYQQALDLIVPAVDSWVVRLVR